MALRVSKPMNDRSCSITSNNNINLKDFGPISANKKIKSRPVDVSLGLKFIKIS